ncbi:MAG: extradiol dioxygenase [Flavipsychrobacter sp.]|nr:extradiol dioxygenase [Flavipsychrobacter sp.]
MIKQFWLNLPVANISRSKEFFTKLGFRFSTHNETPESACMLVGEKDLVVMLFSEKMFKGFTGNAVADTRQGTEALMSIDAESKEEVDELAQKVLDAGGATNHKPYEMKDWMYGCIFSDLDGHRWNILYMDMTKMGGQ